MRRCHRYVASPCRSMASPVGDGGRFLVLGRGEHEDRSGHRSRLMGDKTDTYALALSWYACK